MLSMLKKYRIARNTSIMLITQIAMQFANVIYVGLLARHVGADGIGEIATATALNTLSVLVMGPGLSILYMRDISREPDKASEYLVNMLFMRVLLLVPFVLVNYLVMTISDYSQETRLVVWLYIIVFGTDAFGELFIGLFRTKERLEFEAGTQILMTILNITISIYGISQGWTLLQIVWVTVFAHGMRFIAMLVLTLRFFVKLDARIDVRLASRLLMNSWPFSAFLVIQAFQNKTGVIIMSSTFESNVVGLYGAANTIIAMLLYIPNALAPALLPNLSRLQDKSLEALQHFYSISFRYLAVIGFPLGLGTILVGGDLIEMIYGQEFTGSRPVIQIMAIFLFMIVGYANGPLLQATGRQRFFAWTQGIAALVSVTLNIILVPMYGPIGAAIAFTSAGVSTFIIHSLACHRQLQLPLPFEYLGRVGLATVVMGVSVYVLTRVVGLPWILVALTVAPVVYFGTSIALKTVSIAEIKVLASGEPISPAVSAS